MKLLIIGLLSLALSLNAFAVESKICVITSDIDSEQTDLMIETNSDDSLDSIRLYKTLDKKVVSDESHPVEKVIVDGVVASQREGRDIAILKAKNLDVSTGGTITLDFLYNGISGARKSLNLKLVKTDTSFMLTTMEGAKVNRLVFVGNRLLGKLIGVKEIRASFK